MCEPAKWAFLAWVVVAAVMTIPGGALGATVTGATANGSTSISSSCSVSLTPSIPDALNVANNDTVQTIYNVAWSDVRRANSSSVSSAFTVKVWYPSSSSWYESASHTVFTTGATTGATILTVYTEDVSEGTTMKVEFDVSVSGGWLGCGTLEWDSGLIYLA